jgi:hypothetical protein
MNNPMINMLFNVMKSRGITFPQNINVNDPNQIIQYLMQNGKISQEQYNNAYNQVKQMNNPQQSN